MKAPSGADVRRFSFGDNWRAYAQRALSPQNVENARQSFAELFQDIELSGKSFLDIGFGQGLSLLLAREVGAKVKGIDLDPANLEALRITAGKLGAGDMPEVEIVSILDVDFVEKNKDSYEVVHSWGVLHHTGAMWAAIENAAALAAEGGFLVLAIYNRHWSSPFWRVAKWIYNKSPRLLQRALIALFYPLVYLGKWMVTRGNPRAKKRGMDFYYDLVDWVGGYPYEYAAPVEVIDKVSTLGFECLRVNPPAAPTGCNEYVFERR